MWEEIKKKKKKLSDPSVWIPKILLDWVLDLIASTLVGTPAFRMECLDSRSDFTPDSSSLLTHTLGGRR